MIIESETLTADESATGRERWIHVGEIDRLRWKSLQKFETVPVMDTVELE
jgi:hypothetical protein